MFVFRSFRAVLSTGFRGGEYWSVLCPPAPILSPFGQADNPRRPVPIHDGSSYVRLHCPWLPAPRGLSVGFRWCLVLSPLHGLMVSRYRGGHAFRRSPRRLGIAPSFGHQVVKVLHLASHPRAVSHSFRENESHIPGWDCDGCPSGEASGSPRPPFTPPWTTRASPHALKT